MKRKILATCLLLTMIVGVSACGTSKSSSKEVTQEQQNVEEKDTTDSKSEEKEVEKVFDNAQDFESEGVVLSVPADWTIGTSPINNTLCATDAKGYPNINIVTEDVSSNEITLSKVYCFEAIKTLRTLGYNIDEKSVEDLNVGENKDIAGNSVNYTFNMNNTEFYGRQFYVVQDGTAYVVTYTSLTSDNEDDDYKISEQIFDSFRFSSSDSESDLAGDTSTEESLSDADDTSSDTASVSNGEINEWYQFSLNGKYFELPVDFSDDLFDGTGYHFKDGYAENFELGANEYTNVHLYYNYDGIDKNIGSIQVYAGKETTSIYDCKVIGIRLDNPKTSGGDYTPDLKLFNGLSFDTKYDEFKSVCSSLMDIDYDGTSKTDFVDKNKTNYYDGLSINSFDDDGAIAKIEIKHSGE